VAGERAMSNRGAATIHVRAHFEHDEMVDYPADAVRPRTRGDCLPGGCNEERPCPFVGCRYNLYLDVNPANGSIKLNFFQIELDEIDETCALDVADRGLHTLKEIGALLNLTRAGAQVIEDTALRKLHKRVMRRGIEK
jgi:hypothetical protein